MDMGWLPDRNGYVFDLTAYSANIGSGWEAALFVEPDDVSEVTQTGLHS